MLKRQIICKKVMIIAIPKKNFSQPYNRWKFYYGAEDEISKMEQSHIECMKMTTPYKPLFYHDYNENPAYYFPAQLNDPRYNYVIENVPQADRLPQHGTKYYNYHDFNEVMHANEWPDFQIDHQVEDPMDSNHYLQSNGQGRAVFMAIYLVLFCLSKYKYITNYSICLLWICRYGLLRRTTSI